MTAMVAPGHTTNGVAYMLMMSMYQLHAAGTLVIALVNIIRRRRHSLLRISSDLADGPMNAP